MPVTQQEWYPIYETIRKCVVIIRVMGQHYAPDEQGKLVPNWYVVSHGSGFIYSSANAQLGLITAYHVIKHEPSERIVVWAHTQQDQWVIVDNCTLSPLSNEHQDIAIFSFSPPGRSAAEFESVGFPKHAFDGEILKTGVDIAWCGYPASIDPSVPIFQKGMIAGYHNRQYIVDGMPNPGSSGGPVFYNYSKEIVGMIMARPFEYSRYRLGMLEGEKNRLVQILGSPSGLGVVIPAMNILEVFGVAKKVQ